MQGWVIDATLDTITFNAAPGVGVSNIVVTEYAAGALGGTHRFALGAWSEEYGYPSEVEFYSDRLLWGGTPTDPQMLWASETGAYTSHGKSTPRVDSDAFSFAMNTRQVNAIMDLVPLDKLVVLAKGGEFLMRGGQDDVVAAETVSIKQQSRLGSSGVQARIVNDSAIMVQESGQGVHDIGYRFEADGYKPIEISLFSSHLMEANDLLGIEWAPAPHKSLLFWRDDGTWIGCTYLPDQEVNGWHRHDTGRALATGDGRDEIEDIVCLPGKRQTEIIMLVKRLVDGVETRYIEQLATQFVDDIRDHIYLDSSLTYDGRNNDATTLTLTGGTDWVGEELTLDASAAIFVGASDVGDGFDLAITVDEVDDDGITIEVEYSVRLRIAEFVSTTQVLVETYGTVPEQLRDVATTEWTFKRTTITGFDHLEGRKVVALVDGSVVRPADPVTNGTIELAAPGGVVTAGLPYRAHIETLELNNPGNDAIRDAKKLMTSVGVMVQDSRGIKVCGGNLNEELLYELPQREFEDWGEPTRPLTGYGEVGVSAEWGDNIGRIHLISDDPLPMTVLGVIPRFIKADRVA